MLIGRENIENERERTTSRMYKIAFVVPAAVAAAAACYGCKRERNEMREYKCEKIVTKFLSVIRALDDFHCFASTSVVRRLWTM